MFHVRLQSNQKEAIVSSVHVFTEGVAMSSSDQSCNAYDCIRVFKHRLAIVYKYCTLCLPFNVLVIAILSHVRLYSYPADIPKGLVTTIN